jgi:hypothetical protein
MIGSHFGLLAAIVFRILIKQHFKKYNNDANPSYKRQVEISEF